MSHLDEFHGAIAGFPAVSTTPNDDGSLSVQMTGASDHVKKQVFAQAFDKGSTIQVNGQMVAEAPEDLGNVVEITVHV